MYAAMASDVNEMASNMVFTFGNDAAKSLLGLNYTDL
jgi:hypothetical protein